MTSCFDLWTQATPIANSHVGSHGGYILFLDHGCVSWKSELHPIVTLSPCEAEYVALCSAVCEVKYLRALLDDLGYPQDQATLIWEEEEEEEAVFISVVNTNEDPPNAHQAQHCLVQATGAMSA